MSHDAVLYQYSTAIFKQIFAAFAALTVSASLAFAEGNPKANEAATVTAGNTVLTDRLIRTV